jgi:hypothetical protein
MSLIIVYLAYIYALVAIVDDSNQINRRTKKSMRDFLIIFLLVASNPLSAQRLTWLQQTPSGSVIVNIHPKPLIDPSNPSFGSDYDYSSNFDCADSLFSHLKFHSPRYGDMEEENAELKCYNEIDFAYGFLFENYEWVNNSDLYPLIRVPSSFMWWQDLGNGKWDLNSSQHMYVCGNDRTGYTQTDHQVWQLNSQRQVKIIYHLSSEGKTESRFDFIYTSFGKIQKSTRTDYDSYDSTRYTQHQQEWFYDDKQRDVMMISYEGSLRKFNVKTITQFKQVLNEHLKTGQSPLMNVLDSNQVKELVVYNYGKFGLEQVNCYYNPDEYSIDIHFYSDSIFYNAAGQIIRYAGGKSMGGNSYELSYSYDKVSGRLVQVTGRNYPSCADQGCSEVRVLQSFSYSNNKVSNLTETRFETRYQYKDGKYVDPTEELEEERVYTYKYKIVN